MNIEILNGKDLLIEAKENVAIGFYNIRWVEDENFRDVLVCEYAIQIGDQFNTYHSRDVTRDWFYEIKSKYAFHGLLYKIRFEELMPLLRDLAG